MQAIITSNQAQIQTLCQKHGVEELFVFGSAVRTDFNAESDVDFLVEFQDEEPVSDEDVFAYIENRNGLGHALATLLHTEVDLIRYSGLRNKWLRHFINQEKKLLYASA